MANEEVLIKEATVKGTKDEKKVLITDAIVKGTKEQTPSTPLPARTTEQEDITTAGQRKVNLIWEYTQAFIALSVTASTVTALFIVAIGLKKIDTNQLTSLMQLVGMTLLILGFYFSRTNHQAIGGIGQKESDYQMYKGR